MKLKPGDIVRPGKYLDAVSMYTSQFRLDQHKLRPAHLRTLAGSLRQGEVGIVISVPEDSNTWGGSVMILAPSGEYGWVSKLTLQELNE